MSTKFALFQTEINRIVGEQFHSYAPPPTMRGKLDRAGDAKRVCEDVIQRARAATGTKITVKKRGTLIDDNGYRVEAFAFEIGRVEVEQTLYTALLVDMLFAVVHLLLIRSDITTPRNILFPDVGTAQDWKVLQKCAVRFSPKSSCQRHRVDVGGARYTAAETAAKSYLGQSGTFQQRDLEILQNMSPPKIHVVDLCAIAALTPTYPVDLIPRMVHVLLTKDADDLEETRRVFRALDFSINAQVPDQYVPSILMKGKNSLELWRKSTRFAYIIYSKAENVDCIFAAMSEALMLGGPDFRKYFPYPPVIVGPSIWSNRDCVEIDMRATRFSDEELLVARKYIATLLGQHSQLMLDLTKLWNSTATTPEATITPYPRLWFQSFHHAAGNVLFPASTAFLEYLQLTQEADASRLRLRTDRAARYAEAINRLKAATKAEPWLYDRKPQSSEDAIAILSKDFDAFLHQTEGGPVFAFTEGSLERFANLEHIEAADFITELKKNKLILNKSHPITFRKNDQKRFICVNGPSVTVTDSTGKGAEH